MGASLAMPLRRGFFGYRRGDVINVLERMGAQLDTIARNLDETWREKEALRVQLASARERHARELELQRLRGERVEAESRAEAARIVAEAEEQATRIRVESSRRATDAASRLENLLRVREHVLGELRGILQAYGSLLEEVEHGRSLERVVAEEEGSLEEVLEPRRPPLEHIAGSGDLFPAQVELDAGPFADFAELSAFERSLTRLPKVEDVYVRRFSGDRAEIELTTSEERPLVYDLTHHLPYLVRVRRSDDGLQVEVGVEAAVTGA
jgi:hypothetical protein